MQKTSSIVDKNVQKPLPEQFSMPTWGILIFLIIAMVTLKSFVYIKDEKRHGK
ncbi:MAG: hypothetical protein VXV96_01840 [Bdellovibrionota bacterium]|jgi:hypothetical protein|nr:hypothetical protein [Bdellovibrionota bacterium]